jgi:hypothetical protein
MGGFGIHFHEADRILEVVYPAEPTPADMADYLLRVKNAIDALHDVRWSCLVDQRKLKTAPTAMLDRVALLNVYALQRGMKRSARVVASSEGIADSQRVAHAAQTDAVRVFFSREEALAWLRGG